MPHKGHDVLRRGVGTAARTWPGIASCVGTLERDAGFVDRLLTQAGAYGIDDRLSFPGPRIGPDLDTHYRTSDLLVLASRGETYGMVVTEALAHGLPVVATAAKGLPESLGRAPDGSCPGLLVPPEDPSSLAAALRRWLEDADLRGRLYESARLRRQTLTGWPVTAKALAEVLSAVPTTPALRA